MNERPVRLVVADDCRRSRLTVFFRFFLTIPHFFWLGIWVIGIFFSSIAQWFMTVVRGRPVERLHEFHCSFIRYSTHVGAYLSLAANPFPGFLGEPGYPIDVELDSAPRQGRLGAFFRLLLAVPAWLMLTGINAGGVAAANFYYVASLYLSSLAVVAGFLGWFACLVLGRMPLGLRNVVGYGLRYTAEVYAYSLLVTPVYPSTDTTMPAEAEPPPPHPIRLTVDDDRRRSRLTAFFRLFLAVPHIVWVTLWSIPAFVAAIAQWFITLILGRPSLLLHRFLAAYLRYCTHLGAFLTLVANPFPGFTGSPGYPVDLEIAPPAPQKRLVTLFRLLLAIPALLLSGAFGWLLYGAAVGGWFAALAIGRMPRGLRNAGAHALRYSAQAYAYTMLVTDRYAFSGPPALRPKPPEQPLDEPA